MKRYFMVDPDNEERLLTLPDHVVTQIATDAVDQRNGTEPVQTYWFKATLVSYQDIEVQATSYDEAFEMASRQADDFAVVKLDGSHLILCTHPEGCSQQPYGLDPDDVSVDDK